VTESRTLLLIGAGGFVGAHLAEAARAAGLELVATRRQESADAPACDQLDPTSVAACIDAVAPDLVVNAAGAASVGRSWQIPGETFAANATGVLNLLEAVAERAPQAHVLCLSSADVYGMREEVELPLGEDLRPQPVTPYGVSKATMELLCGQYALARGLTIAVARLFNLIGPGQSDRFAIPGFARQIAAAERDGAAELELELGNAAATRDFVDVREGARALVELSRRGLAGTFNLCSGQGTTIGELSEELARQAGVPVSLREEEGLKRPLDPPALVGDPSRLREAIGFAPETPLARSLADLLDEWRARPVGA
jgi:GDP-4-dehydro-6-deoxy-D-mannose reductase